MSLEFLTSEKGKKKLFFNDHFFFKEKQVGDTIYWKCEYYQKLRCHARVITVNNKVSKQNDSHSHIADVAQVEASRCLNEIKQKAKNCQEVPQVLISHAASKVNQAVAAKLPCIESIKRTIRNVRNKAEAAPSLPGHRRDIVFPDDYRKTNKGEEFLLYDSGATDDRILIFSTEYNLKLLAQSKHWYADGTFKTAPHLFYQLYTIHGLRYNNSIPLIYALLPNKSQDTYNRLLKCIKELAPSASPSTIMIDYEAAMAKAVATEFPATRIRGCFFHFCQSIFRQIQANGLKTRYETDVDFALKVRYLAAIAFVPVAKVVEAFEDLCDANILPEELQPILDYFEDTWVGRLQRRDRRRPPKFAHKMWNCFDTVLEDLPKTNNSIEGWHRGFEQQIAAVHPSIWKFINAIQKEQSLHEMKIEQYLGGQKPVVTKRRYKDNADRIKRIVSDFDGRLDMSEFLRGIAHNIAY